jgi:hypothetical protein
VIIEEDVLAGARVQASFLSDEPIDLSNDWTVFLLSDCCGFLRFPGLRPDIRLGGSKSN